MTFMQHLLVSQATAREAARDVTARTPPPLGPAWASPGLPRMQYLNGRICGAVGRARILGVMKDI